MGVYKKEHDQLFAIGAGMVFWIFISIAIAVVYSVFGLIGALCDAVDKRI